MNLRDVRDSVHVVRARLRVSSVQVHLNLECTRVPEL